ncbi:MAG: Mut7-C RNAse domain-containing protein [Elusimicrobia bacterium]|nr:Mut7-C RNAse domain-containing protein [Elusimicrobiota bacterium]
MSGPGPSFLADAMLGKLARWLSLMGWDAVPADPRATDLELLARASREGRVFLTRDRRVPEVAGLRRVLVESPRLEAQLKQVLGDLGLAADPARWFTRCAMCGAALADLPREAALPLVPPKVRELDTSFRRCPECRRVYWEGTHVERARQKLARWGFGAQSPSGLGGSSRP